MGAGQEARDKRTTSCNIICWWLDKVWCVINGGIALVNLKKQDWILLFARPFPRPYPLVCSAKEREREVRVYQRKRERRKRRERREEERRRRIKVPSLVSRCSSFAFLVLR